MDQVPPPCLNVGCIAERRSSSANRKLKPKYERYLENIIVCLYQPPMGSATSSCPLISRFLNPGSKIGSVGFEEAIARTCVRFVCLVELSWGDSSLLDKSSAACGWEQELIRLPGVASLVVLAK